MMLARVAGAVVTAIGTGLLVAGSGAARARAANASAKKDVCCSSACKSEDAPTTPHSFEPLAARLKAGTSYSFGELLDGISVWILLGLIIAGLISWAVPPQILAAYGSGLLPMLLMTVIGTPMYICAAAATPIAAAMVLSGVSPGTALVFLLAGPVTSMATLAVLRREMGTEALLRYLFGIIATTILVGLSVDQVINSAGVDVRGQIGAAQELLPVWIEGAALMLLIVLAIPPVRRVLARTSWQPS